MKKLSMSVVLRHPLIRLNILTIKLIAVLLGGLFSLNGQAEQTQQIINFEGLSRGYNLYIPDNIKSAARLPLVVVLHGRPGPSQRMADLSDFNSRAEQHGFAVIYPQGLQNQWNYLHGISEYRPQPNDSEFLLKVIEQVSDTYHINNNQIFITGISNGGFMAQRLACYAPEKFAAFASVAAGGYAHMDTACKQGQPVSMLYIHGTSDTKVPWNGLTLKDSQGNLQAVTMPIAESLKFWSNHNQCGNTVNKVEIIESGRSPGTQVRRFQSTECANGAEMVLYAIINGGHNWPGVAGFIPPEIAGLVNLDIHASDVIWTFFKDKSL